MSSARDHRVDLLVRKRPIKPKGLVGAIKNPRLKKDWIMAHFLVVTALVSTGVFYFFKENYPSSNLWLSSIFVSLGWAGVLLNYRNILRRDTFGVDYEAWQLFELAPYLSSLPLTSKTDLLDIEYLGGSDLGLAHVTFQHDGVEYTAKVAYQQDATISAPVLFGRFPPKELANDLRELGEYLEFTLLINPSHRFRLIKLEK